VISLGVGQFVISLGVGQYMISLGVGQYIISLGEIEAWPNCSLRTARGRFMLVKGLRFRLVALNE